MIASTGVQITGTITVTDANLADAWINGSNSGAISIWVDAWSETENCWGGANASVDRVNGDGDYTISGLTAGTYNVNCWVEGYEMETPLHPWPPFNQAATGSA